MQFGNNPGAIQLQGASLQVLDGQTLTLAGGNINIDGGQLLAFGGRVELAGVASPGEVGLTQQGQEWRLIVPEGLMRADVAIVNDAIVAVSSGGGGSIAITARNLTMTGFGTLVQAGIAEGLGTAIAQAGDIDIDATEAVNLDEMFIGNNVETSGMGNAGDINITTGKLSLTNGAEVNTITLGRGGNININTGSLSLNNGAAVDARSLSRGDAGNITITARDTVSFDGVGNNGFSSGAFSNTVNDFSSTAIAHGGDIKINTGSLSLTNGAVVDASTSGQGDAGNITITATDRISIDGVRSDGFASGAFSNVGGAFSTVNSGAIGQSGRIRVNTRLFSIANGAELSVSSQGQGGAGNIEVTAHELRLDNKGSI